MHSINETLINLENIKKLYTNYIISNLEYEELDKEKYYTVTLPIFLIDGSVLEIYIKLTLNCFEISTNILEKIALKFGKRNSEILKDLEKREKFKKIKINILDEIGIELVEDLRKEISIDKDFDAEKEILIYSTIVSKAFNFMFSFYTYNESKKIKKVFKESVINVLSNINKKYNRNIKELEEELTYKTNFWHERRTFLATASDETHLHRIKSDLEEINDKYDKAILVLNKNITYLEPFKKEITKRFFSKNIEFIQVDKTNFSEVKLEEGLINEFKNSNR